MNSSTSSASLIDIIPEKKTVRPKAVKKKSTVLVKTKNEKSDKEKIRQLLDELEAIRTTLEDSRGQGYLFTASAILNNYLDLS